MNLVIVGQESPKLTAVLSELNHVAGQLAYQFNPAYLVDPVMRLNRIKLELGRRTFAGTVTVFTGIKSEPELQLLRGKGALIAHVYGESVRPRGCVLILPGDKFVLSAMGSYGRPGHVYTPEQLLSECRVKHARVKAG